MTASTGGSPPRCARRAAERALGAVAAAACPPGDDGPRAAALASAPADAPGGSIDPAAHGAGDRGRRAAGVPLPAGGTFDGVRWELGGGVSRESEIDGVIAVQRGLPVAAGVARRPRRAHRPAGAAPCAGGPPCAARNRASSLARWPPRRPAAAARRPPAMLADCDASHAREVVYAERIGLTPSTLIERRCHNSGRSRLIGCVTPGMVKGSGRVEQSTRRDGRYTAARVACLAPVDQASSAHSSAPAEVADLGARELVVDDAGHHPDHEDGGAEQPAVAAAAAWSRASAAWVSVRRRGGAHPERDRRQPETAERGSS